MQPRTLTKEDVTFTLEIEPEYVPVRGNALASGDDREDKLAEDEILARLENGDLWAWCTVKVTATWRDLSASEYLGCCSYADADDFKRTGWYYADMCAEALDRLNFDIEQTAASLPWEGES